MAGCANLGAARPLPMRMPMIYVFRILRAGAIAVAVLDVLILFAGYIQCSPKSALPQCGASGPEFADLWIIVAAGAVYVSAFIIQWILTKILG